ncbi:MAG: FHA domain-containing protein [Chloroflexales bacterium]|nr:FHA domain-containing protein [Chloroflexales bacterium]
MQTEFDVSVVPQLVAAQPELVSPASFALGAATYAIGRGPGCNLVVRHPLVSRLHATVELRGARYTLVDMGSVNGTYVNGSRLAGAHQLSNNDQIGLGRSSPMLYFYDPDSTMLDAGVLSYDERTMSFLIGGARLDLSPMQFRLLRHLHQHAGTVCTRESCAAALWGRAYEPELDTSALDQALNSLRRKLRLQGLDGGMIETRRGQGYVLRI